jgi:hypothetical protein
MNFVRGKISNMSYTQKVKLCFDRHCQEILKIKKLTHLSYSRTAPDTT